jgi:hypothetical protein
VKLPESDQFESVEPYDERQAEEREAKLQRRLRRNTYVVIGLMLLLALVLSTRKMLFGVVLGSALGLLNLRWLTGSVRGILSQAVMMQNGRVPPFTAGKLILRYYLVALIIGAALWTGDFHPLGIGAGFAAFVFGVMIEAGYRFFLVILGRETPEDSASETHHNE